MKLSVTVPCYNESKTIPFLLERFNEVIKRDDIEVIFVNNGSEDDTQDVLDRLLGKYRFARTLRIETNLGYGLGITSGLKYGTGEYLAWTHADMQTDPYDVVRGLELIERSGYRKNIFVKGTRIKRPLSDSIFTWGMNIFESMYLGAGLTDINAQPNIFHRSFFESWVNPPDDFSLDLYAFYMARKAKLEVVRFEVLFKKRIYGTSHWNVGCRSKWKFIKRTLDFSFKLKTRIA